MANDTIIITLSLPAALLHKLDQAATEAFASRSEYIRQATMEYIRRSDEYRALLLGLAHNATPLSEEELERMLRQRRMIRAIKKATRPQ